MTYESEDIKNYHTFPFDISLDSSPQTLTIDNPEFFTHNKILNSISVETEERNIKIKTTKDKEVEKKDYDYVIETFNEDVSNAASILLFVVSIIVLFI